MLHGIRLHNTLAVRKAMSKTGYSLSYFWILPAFRITVS